MIKIFYHNVLKFDLINKFKYLSLFNIPCSLQICFIFNLESFQTTVFFIAIFKNFVNKKTKLLLISKNGIIIRLKVFIKNKLLNELFFKIITIISFPINISRFSISYTLTNELMEKIVNFPIYFKFFNAKILISFISINKQELIFISNNYFYYTDKWLNRLRR